MDNPTTTQPAKAASHGATRRLALMSGIAGAAAFTAALLPRGARAQSLVGTKRPNSGDIALLRFVAYAELVEYDLWQQYAELGGISTQAPNAYQAALDRLDGDSDQYITSNRIDELSHAAFLNAYLASVGA